MIVTSAAVPAVVGPALVVNGEINTHKEYDYNRKGKDARSAIGQTGPLSYVMVVVEARGKSEGLTHEGLAELRLELGCQQAYNLDGGNSTQIILCGEKINAREYGKTRDIADMIVFATAVKPE